jgi:hypothetical protein
MLSENDWQEIVHSGRNGLQCVQQMANEMLQRMSDLDKILSTVSMTSGSREIISPIKNLRIRYDSMGSGDFMAPRGNRKHTGIDIEVDAEGEKVAMPLKNGIVIREFFPYFGDSSWRGVEVGNEMFICRLHYVIPITDLIGKEISQGDVIGHTQDISKKYKNISPLKNLQMKNHIHFECFINLSNIIRSYT